MIELKKKAIGGIKSMLEGRLSERLKPKQEDKEPYEPMSEKGDGMPDELPTPEGGVSQEGLEVPDGADVSKLSPEEKQQLEQLYAKMGC